MNVVPTWFGNRRHYGAGKLFAAPLGTWVQSSFAPASTGGVFTLGTSANQLPGSTAALPVGQTDDGHKFANSVSTEKDETAESFYPVAIPIVGVEGKWSVSLKQVNLSNLRLALNGFDAAATSALVSNVSGSGGKVPDASTVVRIKPPTPGQEVRCQLLFVSTEQDFAVVMYKVINTGNLELAFQKGAKGLSLPLEFDLELPDASVASTAYDILVTGADYVESTATE